MLNIKVFSPHLRNHVVLNLYFTDIAPKRYLPSYIELVQNKLEIHIESKAFTLPSHTKTNGLLDIESEHYIYRCVYRLSDDMHIIIIIIYKNEMFLKFTKLVQLWGKNNKQKISYKRIFIQKTRTYNTGWMPKIFYIIYVFLQIIQGGVHCSRKFGHKVQKNHKLPPKIILEISSA